MHLIRAGGLIRSPMQSTINFGIQVSYILGKMNQIYLPITLKYSYVLFFSALHLGTHELGSCLRSLESPIDRKLLPRTLIFASVEECCAKYWSGRQGCIESSYTNKEMNISSQMADA